MKNSKNVLWKPCSSILKYLRVEKPALDLVKFGVNCKFVGGTKNYFCKTRNNEVIQKMKHTHYTCLQIVCGGKLYVD